MKINDFFQEMLNKQEDIFEIQRDLLAQLLYDVLVKDDVGFEDNKQPDYLTLILKAEEYLEEKL
jgi:hypothetical protein